ncbi:GFA family protein [Aurantiacibacter odishensis]|uniref:GFA family protein n=1 Tax=Aurantiacibacter odishensis TaxID=1155476 RepID=UPI000E772563|nr:aldehyde-activating protein [Aurantiacibacter odishensis]
MTLDCLCGDIRITVSDRPDFVHACNCTLCAKTGARWSYFHPDQVQVTGSTKGYRRTDKNRPAAEVHSCTNCGATTHFVLTESAIAAHGNTMMGVNMLLAEPADLAGVELRYPDGRNWQGAGEFGYVREAETL